MIPLTSSTAQLYSVPKLADDGSNWVVYKTRTLAAIGARKLTRHLEGRARKPLELVYHDDKSVTIKGVSTTLTDDQVEEHEDKLDEYQQKEAAVKNQIYGTISDQMLIRVRTLKRLERCGRRWLRHTRVGASCTLSTHENNCLSSNALRMATSECISQKCSDFARFSPAWAEKSRTWISQQ